MRTVTHCSESFVSGQLGDLSRHPQGQDYASIRGPALRRGFR